MGTLLVSLIIGLLAGWLSGLLFKGSGFGILGNIVVGLVGSFVGKYLAGALGISAENFVGTVLVATGGAIVLLFVLNIFTKKK